MAALLTFGAKAHSGFMGVVAVARARHLHRVHVVQFESRVREMDRVLRGGILRSPKLHAQPTFRMEFLLQSGIPRPLALDTFPFSV